MRAYREAPDGLATTAVREGRVTWLAEIVVESPLPDGNQHGQKANTFLRQRVDDPPAIVRIGIAGQDARVHEPPKTIGEDVSGNAEASLKLLEVA